MTQQNLNTPLKKMEHLYTAIVNSDMHRSLAQYAPLTASAISSLHQAYALLTNKGVSTFTKSLQKNYAENLSRKDLNKAFKKPQLETYPREIPNNSFYAAVHCFEFLDLAIAYKHHEQKQSMEEFTEIFDKFLTRPFMVEHPTVLKAFHSLQSNFLLTENKTEASTN